MCSPTETRRAFFIAMMRSRKCGRMVSYSPRGRSSLRCMRCMSGAFTGAAAAIGVGKAVGFGQRFDGVAHRFFRLEIDAQTGQCAVADHLPRLRFDGLDVARELLRVAPSGLVV